MRRAYQLTALALRSLAGALPAAAGLLIGAGAGYLLWPRRLPEAPARVMLPFAVFGAVAGWLAFRIPLPKPVTHGSARFRSRNELDPFRGPDGLIVGRAAQPDHFLLRYAGPGHLLTIAPTRAGKGVGAILPNLLLADRPVIVIDPKGENYRVAARARNRFGPVWALDPFGVTGNESAAYNPLDLLDPGSERFPEDAAALADAIVSDPPGEVREAHWNEEAVALLSGLILLCASSEPPARRNLARVRAYLTQPPETFHQLLEAMQASDAAGGLVARAANRRLGQNEREAASVLSTAQRHTHFLDSTSIAEATSRTDFRFADLARSTGSVFLVLPPDRIPTHARWLRILVAQALGEILRLPEPPAKPVLFLLDECAALGRMPPLERAVGLMAGYGMQVWTIFQDLHQLRAIYGRAAGTFLSNAGIVQAFNVNDLETARWISSMLGADTEVYGGGPDGIRDSSSYSILEAETSGSRRCRDPQFDCNPLMGSRLGDSEGGGSIFYGRSLLEHAAHQLFSTIRRQSGILVGAHSTLPRVGSFWKYQHSRSRPNGQQPICSLHLAIEEPVTVDAVRHALASHTAAPFLVLDQIIL